MRRRASSLVSSLAADRRPGSSSNTRTAVHCDRARRSRLAVLRPTTAAGSGVAETYFLVCSFACADFSSLGELVVIVGNPKHDRLRRMFFHALRKRTHFLTSLTPMIGVIGEQARHRRWTVMGHGRLSKPTARPRSLQPTWRSSRNFRQHPALVTPAST